MLITARSRANVKTQTERISNDALGNDSVRDKRADLDQTIAAQGETAGVGCGDTVVVTGAVGSPVNPVAVK